MRYCVSLMIVAVAALCTVGCGGGGSAQQAMPNKVEVGSTTLFQAAADPSMGTELVALMRTPGMDINAKDKDGMTALHLAAAADNAFAVKKLILAGADATIKNAHGQTAEEVAKEGKKAKAAEAFDRLQ